MQELIEQTIPRATGRTVVLTIGGHTVVVKVELISPGLVAELSFVGPPEMKLEAGEDLKHRQRLAERIQPLLWRLKPLPRRTA